MDIQIVAGAPLDLLTFLLTLPAVTVRVNL
jgi:hypothetical protein